MRIDSNAKYIEMIKIIKVINIKLKIVEIISRFIIFILSITLA